MARSTGLLLCSLLGYGLFPFTVEAQDTLDTRLAPVFTDGINAFDAEDYARAIPPLIRVFNADPAFYQPGRGSAAYWLGQAYFVTDQPDVAAEAWARGWTALTHRDRVDLRLADAFVQHVFEQQDSSRYALAASAYLAMLAHLDAMSPAMDALRARHLAPLALILPDHVREEIGLAEAEEAATAALSEGAGARLVAWWRRMDQLPATPQNERLVEHLERVVYARAHFADERSALGFDDRGKVYVRLGAPSHKTPVRMNQSEPSRATIDDPLSVYYPEGEFWVYRHVDARAHYLFVRKGRDPFRLGQPHDLVPVSLRSQRGSLALLQALEGIYRMLALYHPAGHYGSMYEQMANYRGLLDDVALARTLPSSRRTYKVALPRPAVTAHTLLSQARSEDRRAVRKRDEQVAPSFSNLFDEVDDLPVVLRWARFLDDDGSTRTELYWGLQARELRPSKQVRRRLTKAGHDPSSTYLLDLTVVQQTAAYQFRRLNRKPYLLKAPSDEPALVLPVQSFVVRGDTGRYHLALQWDAYRTSRPARIADFAARIARCVEWMITSSYKISCPYRSAQTRRVSIA